MAVRVLATDLRVVNMQTRMPFKYGIATLTALPHVFLRVQLDVDGVKQWGVAADHLPPKWFTKKPTAPFESDIAEMLDVIGHARQVAEAVEEADSVFDLWMQVYTMQKRWAANEKPDYPPLLWAFGVTLVERAVISAFCQAAAVTFADAVRGNALGIRLGDIREPLEGKQPADLLPKQPLQSIIARHTVGLGDPITADEIADAERVDDGLPQSLDECIAAYGLTHFKLKVFGDPDRDIARLLAIAQLVESSGVDTFRFTLDGNENYQSVEPFQQLWRELAGNAKFKRFMDGLLFVEQPLHRDVALSGETAATFLDWEDRPPMIIDESDGELDSLPRALACGYVGTSHKNCKGVFKGIANACHIAMLNAENTAAEADRYVLSCEDLSNVGPVALLQDLAVVAALGIEHAERNGHHYFAGLSMFDQSLQQAVAAAHGDLYRRHEAGWPTLDVGDGRIEVASVTAAPFGVGFDFDATAFASIDDWSVDTLASLRT